MPLGSSAARSAIATSSEQTLLFPWDTPAVITSNDPTSLEVGLRFSADENGQLIGVRFWMPSQDTTPTITVRAWTSGGTSLALKSVTGFATGGWVRANFDTPIDLSAGTVYVVSRNIEQVGGITYVPARQDAFTNPVTVGDLTALGDGNNGVYSEAPGTFPTLSTDRRSNYFVDPIFLRSDAVAEAAAGGINFKADVTPAPALAARATLVMPEAPAVRIGEHVGSLVVTEKPAIALSIAPATVVVPENPAVAITGARLNNAGSVIVNPAPAIINHRGDLVTTQKPAVEMVRVQWDLVHQSFMVAVTNDAGNTQNWSNPTNAQGANNSTFATWNNTLNLLSLVNKIHGTTVSQSTRPSDLVIDSVHMAIWGSYVGGVDVGVACDLGYRIGGATALDVVKFTRPTGSSADTGTEVQIANATNFDDTLSTATTWANIGLLQFFANAKAIVGIDPTFSIDAIRLRVVAHATDAL